MSDICNFDGKPCYVGATTEDAHWRCGTVQCGRSVVPADTPSISSGGLAERVARALAPTAWAALGTGDTLAQKARRTASLRHAQSAIEATGHADLLAALEAIAAVSVIPGPGQRPIPTPEAMIARRALEKARAA